MDRRSGFWKHEGLSAAAYTVKMFLATMLCLIMIAGTASAATPSWSRSGNFVKSYMLLGNDITALEQVALAQKGLTKASFSYPPGWCAYFVCDCARLAGIPDSIIPYNDSGSGTVSYLYNKLLNSCGAELEPYPRPGDLVFYYCNTTQKFTHVGICLDSRGEVIEGNISGKVTRYNSANYKDSHGDTVSSGAVSRLYVKPAYRTTINDCRISLSYTKTVYTGEYLRPAVCVFLGNRQLQNGTDYIVSWDNNLNAGTAQVEVRGRGNFTGRLTKSYVITPRSISKASVKMTSKRTWTGSQIRPALSVKCNGIVLSKNDYTVSYGANKKIGRGYVSISGKGNYCGTKKVYFTIVPKKVTGVKVTAGLHKLGISWTAPKSGVSGYAVSIKKHSASKWKTYYVKKGKKSCSIGKLTPFVKYDVKVAGYVLIGSKKVKGPASSIRSKRPL